VRELIGRLPRGYSGREQVALRSEAMIWAEQEAKKKSDEDAKRQSEQETKRKADEDAKRAADAEAQRRANEEALRRKAETDEAKRKADAEAAARATPQQRAEADRCTTLLSSTARSGRITFDFGSAELQSESSRTLDKLVEIAKSCPNSRIDITGHTDAVGGADVNDALSIRRAEAVVQYLVGKGIDQGRLTATGFGAAKPLAPNTSAANRALNRRIEFEAKPK
jgi:outer membrane protein OmpA-like peptidoglycan-associated protein